MNRRECFNCAHWVMAPPHDWAPDYPGDTFGHYQLRSHLRGKNLVVSKAGWPGYCSRDPVAVETRSVHRCGRWVCDADNVWLNLSTSATFTREVEEAGLVEKLRAELKVERERSLERYRKLKVAKAKPRTNGAAARAQQEPLNGQP